MATKKSMMVLSTLRAQRAKCAITTYEQPSTTSATAVWMGSSWKASVKRSMYSGRVKYSMIVTQRWGEDAPLNTGQSVKKTGERTLTMNTTPPPRKRARRHSRYRSPLPRRVLFLPSRHEIVQENACAAFIRAAARVGLAVSPFQIHQAEIFADMLCRDLGVDALMSVMQCAGALAGLRDHLSPEAWHHVQQFIQPTMSNTDAM